MSLRSAPDADMAIEPSVKSEPSAETILLKPVGRPGSTHSLLSESTTLQPAGWPTRPKTIKTSKSSIVSDIAVDVITIVLSLAFLVFGIAVRHYNQAPIALHQQAASTLLSAAKIGPSVFPILFACVLGRAAHTVLVWRLEKGERIGLLDLLAGSTSLTSAVTSQVKLRMISYIGLALTAVWALSPIGGQASLRQVATGNSVVSLPSSFVYLNHSGNATMRFQDSDRATYWSIINSIFVACILAPASTRSSPRDSWSNVKIPLIEHYENVSLADSEGWFTTNSSDESTYSSLVGIPVTGINSTDFVNYTVNMQTAYLYIDCPVVNNTADWGPSNFTGYINATGDGAYMWWLNDTQQRAVASSNITPMNFYYYPWGVSLGIYQCNMVTTYIEAAVSCPTYTTCAASKIRRSRLSNPVAAFTQLDVLSYADYSSWFLYATAFVSSVTGHPSTPTLVQQYLVAPDAAAEILIGASAPIQQTTNEQYAIRLNQLLNTYWTCINGYTTIAGGLPSDAATPTEDASLNYISLDTASGTKSTQTPVIECNNSWSIAMLVASFVLLLASLVRPAVYFFFQRGPDVMLNVSSLATRNNPYFPLPVEGTYLPAVDRAKLLKDIRVRFGDVEAEADVGRLAIGSLDVSGKPLVEEVAKGRLYQ